MQIYMVLDKIDDNQLFVPAFQREYVWKREDAKRLMNSLIKNYPTGTMLTWETTNPPEFKGGVQYNEQMGSVKLILDGQQRVTTLYVIIRGIIPPYYTDEEIKRPPVNLYVNVLTLELEYYKQRKMDNNPLWQNLTDIFQKRVKYKTVIKALIESNAVISDDEDDRIDDNFTAIQKILDRDFLEQTVPVHATVKEAIDIFYIVNASGVNLSDAELALAQISGYWPHARKLLKQKLFNMAEHGYVFGLDFLVYVLLGVMYQSGSDMSKLHLESNKEAIQETWERLNNKVLDYVINIMRQHMFVDHTKEINSVYALIPIILYVYNKSELHLSESEILKIKKWFYYSQLRQRYVSQLRQKLDKDLGIVSTSLTPFDDLLNIIKLDRPLEITSDEFVGRDIRHPLYALMRWYFKSMGAVCFTTGVGIRQNMGERYSLEWDHIFPYSLLRDEAGYNPDNRFDYASMQEITNRAVLSQVGNRSKSNQYAKGYLTKTQNDFPSALEKQCIPLKVDLWELDKYQEFLAARRQLLTDKLNEFLASITETENTAIEIPVTELIQEGESKELEFKSSLRWSYDKNELDIILEKVVVKTVAAFANAIGGILLLGVDDDGDILGLDHDYNTLKSGNSDKYQLHIRNIFIKHFGRVFTAQNIDINIISVDGNEICKILIVKSSTPLFVETTDKNGFKQKKFYVRAGNMSDELPIEDASLYINKHFNGG